MNKLYICGIITVFLNLAHTSYSQKHDYNWYLGYQNGPGQFNDILGNIWVDFNEIPPSITSVNLGIVFSNYAGATSDSSGVLLFYTNGLRIYNRLNQIMSGGDTINPGLIWNSSLPSGGYVSFTGAFAIPQPGHPNIYYLVHSDLNRVNNEYFIQNLYYSTIDMNANNGLGRVLAKNQVLMTGDLIWPSAVKHGNGRDWWIMCGQRSEPANTRFLLSATGISGPFVQDSGDPEFALIEYAGKSLFSQDGNLYLRHDTHNALRLYDFDRCSGELSNLRLIPFQSDLPSWMATFSPNNRYLYLNRPDWMWTLDVQANDIGATFDTLAFWELQYCPVPPFSTGYLLPQLGPDGKIYCSVSSSSPCMNVIHRPDLPGYAADCEEAGVSLGRFNYTTICPAPNYRLAEWTESPCDTFNFQQTDDSFLRTHYDRELANAYPKRGYTVLSGIKTADCKGCTKEQLKILQNPFEFIKYRVEYMETGVIPKEWMELPAEGEVIKSLLIPRKE